MDEVDEEEEKPKQIYGFSRIMKSYNPIAGWASVIFGCIASCIMPMFGFYFGNLIFVIMDSKSPTFAETRNFWIHIGIGIMCGAAIVSYFQKYMYAISGEELTQTVRNDLFREIMYKNVYWFDRKSRAPGILSVVFSEDITKLNGLSTEIVSTLGEMFFCLTIGMCISAFFQWRMTLICIAITPMVMFGGFFMSKLKWKTDHAKPEQKGMDKLTDKSGDPYDESNALLSDVITNYRTVISFGNENIESIMEKYEGLLIKPLAKRIVNVHLVGIAYGYSMCIRFIFIGVVFFIGSKLTVEYGLNSKDVFLSIYVIFTAAMGAGFAMSSVPSATQAKESAANIFSMIDDKSEIDVRDYHGKLKEVPHGTIEFKNINFKYPSRAKMVLEDFNMVIPAGKKIGLVGHSGCGKSTITNILLRFYQLKLGDVLIDGQNINEYDISELRK